MAMKQWVDKSIQKSKAALGVSEEGPTSQDISAGETEAMNDAPGCSEVEWEEPTTILPREELDIRLEHIRKFDKWLHMLRATKGEFTHLHEVESRGLRAYKIEQLDRTAVAWLLVVDLDFLKKYAEVAETHPDNGPENILQHACCIRRVMKDFLSRDIFTPEGQYLSNKQAICLIRGTPCVNRCQILVRQMSLLDFWHGSLLINEDQEKMTHEQRLKLAAKIASMFGCETGISGSPWNHICFDKALSTLWGELRFGLKFLELQFHWMPRRKDVSFLKAENRTKEAILEQFDGTWGDDGNHGLNGRVPKSGDIIWVPVKFCDWGSMKLAIQIR
ncbi:hypothetical protein V8F33_006467 [Rhypophila sp. PSN 637]